MAERANETVDVADGSPSSPVTLAIEVCVFGLTGDELGVVVVNRPDAPPGSLGLPRDSVAAGETIKNASARVLFEHLHLDPERHERFMVPPRVDAPLTETYALTAVTFVEAAALSLAPGTGTERAFLAPIDDVIANRSNNVINDGSDTVTRARLYGASLLAGRSIGLALLGPHFTLGDLRHVYELFSPGMVLDDANFARQVLGRPGFVEPVGNESGPLSSENPQARRRRDRGRPARLFTAGGARTLEPPLRLSGVSHAS